MQHRHERIYVETDRHRISGVLTLPFDGYRCTGWPKMTIVRGHVVMREGEILGAPIGQGVHFRG